jgi:hypothetical protein
MPKPSPRMLKATEEFPSPPGEAIPYRAAILAIILAIVLMAASFVTALADPGEVERSAEQSTVSSVPSTEIRAN